MSICGTHFLPFVFHAITASCLTAIDANRGLPQNWWLYRQLMIYKYV